MKPDPHIAFQAIQRGDLQALRDYLARKGSPNAADVLGYSLLHEAAARRQAEAIDLLLEAGARVNRRDADQRTPLTMALEVDESFGGEEPASLLVADGSLVMFHRLPTPVHERDVQRRIVRRLLEAGAQANLKKRSGEVTTLALAGFKPPLSLAVQAGDLALVRLLLGRGADPNASDYFGDTALIEAAFRLDAGAVRILAAAGADPNIADRKHRRTPLLWAIHNHGRLPRIVAKDAEQVRRRRSAARHGRRLVEALLEAGSRVDVEDRQGFTPLIACLEAGRADLLRRLLRAGADPHRRNRCGETALSYLAKLDTGEGENARLYRILKSRAGTNDGE